MASKSETNQSNRSISIANIISMLGLIALGFLTFIGKFFTTGGDWQESIILALILLAVGALLLFYLMKAKQAENHLDGWRKAEWVFFFLYLIFVAYTVYGSGIVHYFALTAHKEEVRTVGEEDIKKVKDMIETYKDDMKNALEESGANVRDAVKAMKKDGKTSDDLKIWCKDSLEVVDGQWELDESRYEGWKKAREHELIGVNFNSAMYADTTRLDRYEEAIQRWYLFEMPVAAHNMERLSQNIAEGLNELARNAKLPEIEVRQSVYYLVNKNSLSAYNISCGSMELKETLKKDYGFSLKGLIIVLIIHVVVLVSYFTANRSRAVRNKKRYEDGGQLL